MNDLVENLDQKRRKYLLGYLVGFGTFFILWLIRFVLRETGLLNDQWNHLMIVFLWLSIPVQVYFGIGLNRIKVAVQKDPRLYEALYDELVRQHEIRAWRYASIAMGTCLGIFFFINIFILPIKDLTAVILTTIFAGSAGYNFSFYFMNRD